VGGVGAARAKLILFGEHAAVHGHPALGMSLPERTAVRVSGPLRDEWDVSRIPPPDREVLRHVLQKIEQALAVRPLRGSISIASGIPRGVGFGSSAALCGAVARALVSRLPTADRGGPDRVWQVAHEAERIFHGTPSGIDTGLSLGAGMQLLQPRPPGLPASERIAPAPVWLVVSATARDSACGALIAGIASRMKAGDPSTAADLDELGRLAVAARDALTGNAPDPARAVGDLAEKAMGILRRLGLGNSGQDVLMIAGREAGALGGKLSGGGGGGAFFLVAPDRRTAVLIARAVGAAAVAGGVELCAQPRLVRT
jgi:mevalonate kinase